MAEGRIINGYTIRRLIDDGAYGSVYKAEKGRETFAFKIMVVRKLNNQSIFEQVTFSKSEVEALKRLSHKFLLRYVDRFMDPSHRDQTCVVMELIDRPSKSFKTLLQEKRVARETFLEIEIRAWIIQLLLALVHIHEINIIHRELKPNNIFWTPEGYVKLGDFGLMKVLRPEVSVAVTLSRSDENYRAPEMWRGGPYRNKVDLWALGCFLFELMYMKLAFPNDGGRDALIDRITRCQYVPDESVQFDEILKKILRRLLTVDANLRPSAMCMLNKKYLSNYVLQICEYHKVRNPTIQLCEPLKDESEDSAVAEGQADEVAQILTPDEKGNFPPFSWPVGLPSAPSEAQCTWKDMLLPDEKSGKLYFPRLQVTLPRTGGVISVLLCLVRRPPDIVNPPAGVADLVPIELVRNFKKDMRLFVMSEGYVDQQNLPLYLYFKLKIRFPVRNDINPYVFYRDDLDVEVSNEVDTLVAVDDFPWDQFDPYQLPSVEVTITVVE